MTQLYVQSLPKVLFFKGKFSHPPLPLGTMLIYYRKKKGVMEYAFSCGLFDIFLYFQHCFGGKGGGSGSIQENK